MKSILVFSMMMMISVSAWAHTKKTDATVHAIQTVIEKFNREEVQSISRFQGLKGWFENDRYLVRIYFPENASIQYSCYEHVMNGSEMMMCDKVQS